jgi:hypothetical protein
MHEGNAVRLSALLRLDRERRNQEAEGERHGEECHWTIPQSAFRNPQ